MALQPFDNMDPMTTTPPEPDYDQETMRILDLCAVRVDRPNDYFYEKVNAELRAAHAAGVAAGREKLQILRSDYESLRIMNENQWKIIECQRDREYRMADERDSAHRMLDNFVDAVGGSDVCGEHSNLNDPWDRAHDEVLLWEQAIKDAITELFAIEKRAEEACGVGQQHTGNVGHALRALKILRTALRCEERDDRQRSTTEPKGDSDYGN